MATTSVTGLPGYAASKASTVTFCASAVGASHVHDPVPASDVSSLPIPDSRGVTSAGITGLP